LTAERVGSWTSSAWMRARNGVRNVVRGWGAARVSATLRRWTTLRTLARCTPRWRAILLSAQCSAKARRRISAWVAAGNMGHLLVRPLVYHPPTRVVHRVSYPERVGATWG